MSAPTVRGTTRERVAALLRAEIIDGRLAPGVTLRVETVTERLGVSNSPLREAFVQLEAEGLVEVTPNRGVVVAPLTRAGASDLVRIGSLLWTSGIRWILPTMEPATVDQLRRIDVEFGLALQSGDLGGAVVDSESFETVMLSSSWSTELVRSIEAVRPRLQRLGRMTASYPLMERRRVLHAAVIAKAGSTDSDPVVAALDDYWAALRQAVEVMPGVAP
jgi:DNA-binding GntR family transcriptional regulator